MNNSQAQTDQNMRKRLNVDSPSFTPSLAEGSGAMNSASKITAISPKAASAIPFTPKSKSGTATPPISSRDHSSEWSSHDIPEFIPQTFNPNQLTDSNSSNPLADPFNPYADHSYQSLDPSPPSHAVNPYATDPTAAGQASFYPQQQNAFTQPLQYHLYAPSGPHRENLLAYQRTAHDFFISENLRQDLQRKSEATSQVLLSSNLPANIEHFHSLVPLDNTNQKNAAAFGYSSWVYKAISSKDGFAYVLRRLEGFRLTSEKAIRTVAAWKRISNGGVVTVHDAFTTRAFGDSSLVFVTDYHPLSKTLTEQHLLQSSGYQRARTSNVLVPEQILWGYIVQIASALKAVHASGLAARTISPSKIIITSKNRIRLNACGILDVIQASDARPIADLQREDMIHLGRLLVALATNNSNAASNPKAIEAMSRSYSERFKHCVTSLLQNPPDINVFTASIADQAFNVFDNALHLEDEVNADLNRELENGRLVRLLTKLGCINERPEQNEQTHSANQWSETGERYYLKLFRDFVFHQVNHDGRPVVDLGHIVTCLNKLDAGVEEKVALVSRDEQNVLVVSYKEIKRALESSFQELMKASTKRA